MANGSANRSRRWPLFWSELVGTALLLLAGISIVVLMFGAGTPMERLVPDEGRRRLITGFLFGSVGASIALSPVGKVSGAHINPIVTLAFWLWGKLDSRTALGYVLAQLLGACLGVVPILGWGSMGRSVAFGATVPGTGVPSGIALVGEAITTFTMVTLLTLFLGFRELRRFTPALFPFLYAVMSFLEGPISGTSTNPARSLGPALISGAWQGWWVYWVGPLLGTLAATVACRAFARRIQVAKLYYFDTEPEGLLRRPATPQLAGQ